ncbi:MAG: SH3 domain-containing protein [Propionibacteriaceae bacterium]|nr:SH3 domain-containing protein [Propionibacteriaceae bacterium]
MAGPRRAYADTDAFDVPVEAEGVECSPRRAASDEAPAVASFTKSSRRIGLWRRSLAPVAVMAAFSTMVGVGIFNRPVEAVPAPEQAVMGVAPDGSELAGLSRAATRPELEGDLAEGVPSPTPTPEATASPEPEQEPAESPAPKPAEPTVPALGKDAGTRYVTRGGVNLRSGPGTDSEVIATLNSGQQVTITNVVQDEWQQINRDGSAAWVASKFLAAKPSKKPSAPRSSEVPEGEVASSSGGYSTAPCRHGSAIESGITANTKRVFRAFCAEFPQIKSYGGYRRAESWSYHTRGAAIDAMVYDRDLGWQMAKWAAANAGALKIDQVIYAQRIWTKQRPTWRPMADRGSVTANHYDHVHISVG